MSKPIIGVTPLWDEERQSVWMLPEYLNAIRAAGGIPVILPLTADDSDIHQLIATVDGVLLTGGPDVSPELYGETDRTGLVKTCPKRDALEVMVLKEALHKDKPVLGICRGIQLLNSALGGSLWQDLPSEHPSEITHRQAAPYENPTHCVVLSGPLKDLTGKSEIKVNSRHHQAVKAVSPLLTPMVFSPDNLVEAVYMRDKRFVWAVQWHPEYLYKKDPDASAIFEALINSCRA